jgi:hypothetical protein
MDMGVIPLGQLEFFYDGRGREGWQPERRPSPGRLSRHCEERSDAAISIALHSGAAGA